MKPLNLGMGTTRGVWWQKTEIFCDIVASGLERSPSTLLPLL